MTPFRLVLRSLTYHWRTNLAVALGVAAAVSVLAGALIVGDSVRGSLRAIALGRLGNTHDVLSSSSFFRDALADDMAAATGGPAAPLVAASAFVTHEPSGRRAANVLVYGVDERFWKFHGREPRDGVYVSPALAAELGASPSDVLLARLQKPSAIPVESLFAHKDDLGRTIRLTMTAALPRDALGEFALQPQQAEVRALFAPMRRIQRDLGVPTRVNTVLVGEGTRSAESAYRQAVTLDDLGVRVRPAGDGSTIAVEHASGILSALAAVAAEQAGQSAGLSPTPVFAYLANTMRKGDRVVPYSLAAALDLSKLPVALPASPDHNAIVLNDWTARELGAAPGDSIEMEFYLWDAAAGLRTATARFSVLAITPMSGLAGDRTLAPEYPGITEAASLADWDPPFPIDLSKVRPQDEKYWDQFRATPKAFISYERGRDLWATRYGTSTSIRFPVPAGRTASEVADALKSGLRSSLTPSAMGVTLAPVRRMALASSSGATDFGEYFTYFSFFLVVSALLLAALFFRLGVEQRLRQVGILRASGYPVATIRRLLVTEALLLAAIGAAVGMAGALGYAHAIVFALRTWWVGAVGTTLLEVHAGWRPLAAGAFAGMVAAIVCVALSLRAVARATPRALLTAQSLDAPAAADPRKASRRRWAAIAFAALGIVLMAAGFASAAAQAGAFFGAGASLLVACLVLLSAWLRGREAKTLAGRGPRAVARLGFRSAAFRPSRSVLSAALIASAAFIIVSVEAFRRGAELSSDPRSGTGGFALLAKAEVPLLHNPNDPAGRDALMIRAPEFQSATFARFRIRPGDDASCLNLYRPGNPTIVAPEPAFIDSNRFSFAESAAVSEDERANPWRLLQRQFEDGVVPAIADATSLQYVLHSAVGDVFTMDIGADRPLRLRFVGALRDSVLQGELVIAEEQFIRLFPGRGGYGFFLIDARQVRSPAEATALAGIVERELDAFGLDAISTAERLAAFHRVENTYLSTFQALGGLGLLLGTIGLATVMFRNVLERRRELALLRAVGYNARHVSLMIVAEAAFVLIVGLAAGAACAAIAIAPAWLGRGGSVPGPGLALLLGGVAVAGLLSSVVATRAALSGDLLSALRAE